MTLRIEFDLNLALVVGSYKDMKCSFSSPESQGFKTAGGGRWI